MPRFRLIYAHENNLIGPAEPTPHIFVTGGDQGSYNRFSYSPPGGAANIDYLNSHIAVVLEGTEPWLFSPSDLVDFFQISIFDSAGRLVRSEFKAAIFGLENFIQNRYLQQFNSQEHLAIDVTPFGYSTEVIGDERVPARQVYRFEYRINPKYGESDPINVILELNGQNLKILPLSFWVPVTIQDVAPAFPWNKSA